ncbi:MAG: GumC family protein [Verrucomicrobiota bacterium]
MNPKNTPPPSSGSMGLNDVLFVLFRHKWKIIFFTLLGCGAAVGVYFFRPPEYVSESKVLIRYIKDDKGPDAAVETDIVRPEARGSSIVSSELEIFQSRDSIVRAVRRIGASKILAKYGGGTNELVAAGVLFSNLKVEGTKSGVIIAELRMKDPDLAQKALDAMVEEYLQRTGEIHRAGGTFDFLQDQTGRIRQSLAAMDEELRKAKQNADITTLAETKSENAKQLSSFQAQINATEAELAQKEAQLLEYEKMGAMSNAKKEEDSNNQSPKASPADLAKAQSLVKKLEGLKNHESELLLTYTESSKFVVQVRDQITEVEKEIKATGIDPDQLLAMSNAGKASVSPIKLFDREAARAEIAALKSKLIVLNSQLEKVNDKIKKVNQAEDSIVALQRKRDLTEESYLYFSKSLERARIDQDVDSGKLNNIQVVERATLAKQDLKPFLKMVGMAFFGCFGTGLALAFLSDLVFDPTFKRSREVENTVGIPVLATIPRLGRNGHRKRLKAAKNGDIGKPAELYLENGEIPPWDDNDPMMDYYEAVRDRVVMSYEGDPHKPKIVGLTSCSKNAGVSRLATGLAASLSRDVERNVLLIGLEKNKVSVSSFAKGRPSSGTPELNHNDESQALVQQNLSSLTTTGRNLAGASIVQSFSDLLPKFKTADYDYIIFDLPPITQTSGSLRLASQMERTLLVVEAEETPKATVKRAKSLMATSKTQLYAVLNKTKSYGPKILHEDI